MTDRNQKPQVPLRVQAQNSGKTHFGYRSVGADEKAKKVAEVFDSVAGRYDIMNDLMSLGLHRLWKKVAIEFCAVQPGEIILDLAAGTGDLSLALKRKTGAHGLVLLSDININMLNIGRDRLIDLGLVQGLSPVQADAQAIPIQDHRLDLITMAFGLRNVTDQAQVLAETFRALKPGGRLVVLEFSRLKIKPLKPLYDLYSFAVLPRLGKLVAGDSGSYRYLAESIRMHPDQKTLQGMMEDAGFERCQYHNLSGGIVALHRGFKPLDPEAIP